MEDITQMTDYVDGDINPEVRQSNLTTNKHLKRQNHNKAANPSYIKNTNLYSEEDTGPFIVFITTNDRNEDNIKRANLGDIHPMQIGRKLRGNDSKIKWIKRKGRNLIQATYEDYKSANELIKNQEKLLPQNWIAYIPDFKISRIAIGKDIQADLSEEEIRKEIEWFDKQFKIIRMERFMKRIKNGENQSIVPTTTVKFTIAGQEIPRAMIIYKMIIPLEPFEPRVKRCNKCQRFGHLEKQCRGKVTCPKCGENHHNDQCPNEKTECANCGLNHGAFSKACPVWKKEEILNKLMAHMNIRRKEADSIIKIYKISSIKEAMEWIKSKNK